MATKISLLPGSFRWPLHTSPNSPGTDTPKEARCHQVQVPPPCSLSPLLLAHRSFSSSMVNSSSQTQSPCGYWRGPEESQPSLGVRVNPSWPSLIWLGEGWDVGEPGEMKRGTWDEWEEGQSTRWRPENWVPDLAQSLHSVQAPSSPVPQFPHLSMRWVY